MCVMFYRYFIEVFVLCDEVVMRDAASVAGLDEAAVFKVFVDGEALLFEMVVEE